MKIRVNRELLEKYLENRCNPDEEKQVLRWLKSSESNEHILDDIEDEWSEFEIDEAEIREGAFEKSYEKLQQKISGPTPIFQLKPWMKIAATISIFLLVGLVVYTLSHNHSGGEYLVLANTGGLSTVVLSDGSRVTLSAGSTLKYPAHLTGSNRQVFLDGEAYFDVSHNTQPLVIYAGNTATKVFRSALNISAFSDDEEVVVAVDKGEAQISRSEDTITYPLLKLRIPKVMPLIKLRPVATVEYNEYLTFNKEEGTISKKENFNEKEVFGWKDGIIYFNEADSAKVVKKLERWYGVDIKVNGCLGKETFTGEFVNESLDDVLSRMMASPHLKYRIVGDEVLIEGTCI